MNPPNSRSQLLVLTALALALFMPACGSALTAQSTRQILPEFQGSALEHKKLLLVPHFPSDVAKDGTYPVSQALMLEAAKQFSGVDPESAMSLRIVQLGATQVQRSFKDRDQPINVTTLPTDQSLAFQAEPDHYLNVSVDGTTRYLVPKPEALKALGASADYTIVVNSLRFNASETFSRNNGVSRLSKDIHGEARFLLFGYAEGRVLAEGTVNAFAGYKGDPDLSHLDTLMRYIYEEIVAKPPFRK